MRGLCENGKVAPLFNHLYGLVILTFYWLFLSLYLFVYIIPRYSQFTKIVLDQFSMEEAENSTSFLKFQVTNLAFFLIFLLLMIFMILAIIYSLKKLSKVKLKRHNLNTFYSTVFWGILHFVFVVIFFAALNKNSYLVLNVFRFILILTSHFLKPILTIIEARKKLPELFIDNRILTIYPTKFFVSSTNIIPRTEPLMPLIPFQQNARWVLSFIKVH